MRRTPEPARRTRIGAGALGCLFALVLVATAPGSAGAWTRVNLTPSGAEFGFPKAGLDRDGDGVFTWQNQGNGNVQARGRARTGALSPIQSLASAGQGGAFTDLAVRPNGAAIVVYENGNTGAIEARFRSATGALSAVQTIAFPAAEADDPRVAFDPSGNAVFVWSNGANGQIQTRVRAANGTLGPTQNLSAPGQFAAFPKLEIGPNGTAVFAWQRFDGANQRAQTRSRSSSGTLSPIQNLSPAGEIGIEPFLGVDSSGRAVFVWTGPSSTIKTRARSAAGGLTPVQNLATGSLPGIAVEAGGEAVYIWEVLDSSCGLCRRVQTRTRSPAGALGPIQSLSPATNDSQFAQIELDSDGDGFVTWEHEVSSLDVRIQARERFVDGHFDPTKTLSAPGEDATFGCCPPTTAVDGDNLAGPTDFAVTWFVDLQVQAAFQGHTSTAAKGPAARSG